VRDAHKIVVMSGGKLAEEGTHEQLLARQGAYYDLIRAQQFDDEKKRADTIDEEEHDEEQEKLLRRLSSKNIGTIQHDPIETSSRRSSIYRRVSLQHNRLSSTFVTPGGNQEQEDEPNYPTWTLIKFIFSFNKPESFLMVTGVFFCIISGLANPAQAGMWIELYPYHACIRNPAY
jgi:ATP-binding cassette, subfamily B (MDR/TAP), member 1